MKLSLQELKSVMSPLSELGKGELSFEVGGVTLFLRALTPEEEIHVQRYARQALAEGEPADQASALEYLDRFRICSLGYSLVQAGNLDFRGIEFIETGEKLPNGTPIKVRKHEGVMQLVQSWSRNMVNAVFKKFGELQNRVEKEVDGLIEFDDVDYDAEIARLEDRIRELKEAKSKADLSTRDPRTDARDKAIKPPRPTSPVSADTEQDQQNTKTEYETLAVPSDIDREIEDEVEADASLLYEPDEDDDDLVESASPQSPQATARPSLFDRVKGQVSPPAAGVAVSSAPVPKQDPEEHPEEHPEDYDVPHSFVDPQDPESMERAVAEENRRLMAQRSARSAVPHLAAKRTAEELAGEQGGPKLAGRMGDMEVYKMPTQTMTDRKAPTSLQPIAAPPKSTKNPKFRPVR